MTQNIVMPKGRVQVFTTDEQHITPVSSGKYQNALRHVLNPGRMSDGVARTICGRCCGSWNQLTPVPVEDFTSSNASCTYCRDLLLKGRS